MAVLMHNGVVADTPLTLTDQIRVSVPDLTQQDRKTYGPMPFNPIVSGLGGIRLPNRGDRAVIGIDEGRGRQWVISWHRADTTPPPYTEEGGGGSVGPAGPEGPEGPAGPAGPTGPAGEDAYKGDYNPALTYDKGDIVRYEDWFWQANQAIIAADAPHTGLSWDLITTPIRVDGTTGQVLAKASDFDYDTEWIDLPAPSSIPLVSALPGSPSDGDQVDFQNAAMAAEGVRWRLVYHSGSALANKWEFVGGSEFETTRSGGITTASSAPVALTSGPTFTIPLSGVYRLELSSDFAANSATGGWAQSLLYADAVSTGVAAYYVFPINNSGMRISLHGINKATLTAGQVISVKVACANATSMVFYGHQFKVVPIRVG